MYILHFLHDWAMQEGSTRFKLTGRLDLSQMQTLFKQKKFMSKYSDKYIIVHIDMTCQYIDRICSQL